jgi:DNA polymerase III sliding clamp (beta) subunit (PCNA family)
MSTLHVVSDSIDSGGSHIQVSARADELGTRTEEVPANVSVLQDSKIAFNYRYLLDMFKAHKGKTMTMGIITPSSPGRFDVEDCTSVVMPMHIQW